MKALEKKPIPTFEVVCVCVCISIKGTRKGRAKKKKNMCLNTVMQESQQKEQTLSL